MSESPISTLRRGAVALRKDAQAFHPESREHRAYVATAAWLDAEAEAHEGAMAVSEGVCGIAVAIGAGEHRIQVAASTLDQAIAVARIYLNEDA